MAAHANGEESHPKYSSDVEARKSLLIASQEQASSTSQTLSICIIASSASLLGLWASGSSSVKTRATSVTAILVLLSSLPFGLLTWLEHDRNMKPSFILFAYLFLSIILDLPRCRTLWMTEASSTIPAIFTTSLALRLALILVDSADKRSILIAKYQLFSKETTASTISRSVFWWLGPLFLGGYKRNLSLDDLYALDPKLESEALYRVYQEAWETGMYAPCQ